MAEIARPFTDADIVDVVGVPKKGGLDLVILAEGPVDDSPSTLKQLEDKILAYIGGAANPKFLEYYGQSPGAPIAIYISCAYPIAKSALNLIERMKVIAAASGILLAVRKQMGDVH